MVPRMTSGAIHSCNAQEKKDGASAAGAFGNRVTAPEGNKHQESVEEFIEKY